MRDEIKSRIDAVRCGEVPEGYQQVDGYLIPEAWRLEAFSKKFKRSLRRNTSACNNVLTISAQLGLVSQKEYYDKDIASEDKSGYFLLQRGEFAYNKSYSSGYPYGQLNALKSMKKGSYLRCISALNQSKRRTLTFIPTILRQAYIIERYTDALKKAQGTTDY